MINEKIQPKELSGNIEKKSIYVIYRGKTQGIYVTFEEVIAQQIEKEKDGGVSWKNIQILIKLFHMQQVFWE
jgi:hypothetical protein